MTTAYTYLNLLIILYICSSLLLILFYYTGINANCSLSILVEWEQQSMWGIEVKGESHMCLKVREGLWQRYWSES